MAVTALVVFLVAFVTAVVATPLAGRLARRVGMLDHPGPLKVQRDPIPYLGGLGLFAALAVGVGAVRPAFLLPLVLVLALGLADDRHPLPPVVRLACEVGVGAVAAAVVHTGLPAPFGPLAVAGAVVVLVNALNLIDGLDGLATGVGLVAALGFAVVLAGDDRSLAAAVAGAAAGFLVHNRPPARIYLGDGGAYLVGTALAMLLASAWSSDAKTSTGVAALVLVGVPVAEMAVAVLRRLRARKPLFYGDRAHVYDQLVDRGWSAPRASGACVAAQAVLAVLAIIAASLSLQMAVTVVVTTSIAIVLIVGVGGFLTPSGTGGVR